MPSSFFRMDARLLFASTCGSIFELFDFFIFIFLSPLLMTIFFPASEHAAAQVFFYLSISISYLLRPIGGFILGHFGDKYGRKNVLTFSLLCMSVPSLVIGLLPSYAQIGYTAPVLLLMARIFQGFSLGGELPSSIAFIFEKMNAASVSSKRNIYLYCAFLTCGANIGVAGASTCVNLLSRETSSSFMHHIGWRIPFLLGGILAGVGFYIRKNLKESDLFLSYSHVPKHTHRLPLFHIWKEEKASVSIGFLFCLVIALTTSVFHVFLPQIWMSYFQLDLSHSASLGMVGALTLALSSLFFALLARSISPLKTMRVCLGLLGGLFLAAFFYFPDNRSLLGSENVSFLYAFVGVVSVLLGSVNGILFALLASLFPTPVRVTGIATSYNLSYVLGAGLTPLWTHALFRVSGHPHTLFLVCLLGSTLAFIASYFARHVRFA